MITFVEFLMMHQNDTGWHSLHRSCTEKFQDSKLCIFIRLLMICEIFDGLIRGDFPGYNFSAAAGFNIVYEHRHWLTQPKHNTSSNCHHFHSPRKASIVRRKRLSPLMTFIISMLLSSFTLLFITLPDLLYGTVIISYICYFSLRHFSMVMYFINVGISLHAGFISR